MSKFKLLNGLSNSRIVEINIPNQPRGIGEVIDLHPTEVLTYREESYYVPTVTTPEELERIRRHQISIIAEKIYNDNNFFVYDRREEGSPFTNSIVSLDIVLR